MKKIYILAVLLLASLSTFAQNGRTLYNKYSDQADVQAVYISPAMFRLMGKIPDLNTGNGSVNVAPLIKTLSGFYLLSTERNDLSGELSADVERFVKKGHYELLMEAKDNGDVVRMYTVGDETVVNSFVLLARDGSETSFIAIDGVMPREQLEALIAEAAQ